MKIFKTELERRIARKFKEINEKIKTSFSLIRQDIDDMQKSLETVKKHIKNQEKQYKYAKKQDNKIRAKFKRDVDEFTQKISQLNLALERVKEIQNTVVLKKDLANIEDTIKSEFKEQIQDIKNQAKDSEKRIKALESGKPKEKTKEKKFWFFKKNNYL
jgi:hypothetical protein